MLPRKYLRIVEICRVAAAMCHVLGVRPMVVRRGIKWRGTGPTHTEFARLTSASLNGAALEVKVRGQVGASPCKPQESVWTACGAIIAFVASRGLTDL